jgi:hypothetical protein
LFLLLFCCLFGRLFATNSVSIFVVLAIEGLGLPAPPPPTPLVDTPLTLFTPPTSPGAAD